MKRGFLLANSNSNGIQWALSLDEWEQLDYEFNDRTMKTEVQYVRITSQIEISTGLSIVCWNGKDKTHCLDHYHHVDCEKRHLLTHRGVIYRLMQERFLQYAANQLRWCRACVDEYNKHALHRRTKAQTREYQVVSLLGTRSNANFFSALPNELLELVLSYLKLPFIPLLSFTTCEQSAD